MYSASVDDVDTVGCLARGDEVDEGAINKQSHSSPRKTSCQRWHGPSPRQSATIMMVTLHLSLEVLLVSLSTKGISTVVLR